MLLNQCSGQRPRSRAVVIRTPHPISTGYDVHIGCPRVATKGRSFPKEARELHDIKASHETPQRSYDFNTLFNQRRTPLIRERLPCFHLIITNKSFALTVFLNIFCSLHTLFHRLFPCNATTDNMSDTNQLPQTYSTQDPVFKHSEKKHNGRSPQREYFFHNLFVVTIQ